MIELHATFPASYSNPIPAENHNCYFISFVFASTAARLIFNFNKDEMRGGSAPVGSPNGRRDKQNMPSLDFRKLRITQESVVFALAGDPVRYLLAHAAQLSYARQPYRARPKRLDPGHPRTRHGPGRDRPRHRSGDGRDHGRGGLLGPLADDPSTRAARLGLAPRRCLLVIAGLVSGVLIAYAVVPAIFTTLAMGLVIYGVGRAWLFEVDVQNTPTTSASSSSSATRRSSDCPC